jgi:hypothetical protein
MAEMVMPNHEKRRRSIKRELALVALVATLLVGFGLVRMQSALAAIPGVTVVGSCGGPSSPNNFMDVTNSRTTSITIDVGGVDTDTVPPSGNPIGQHTFAPGEHFTFDIPKQFDNATASDHNNSSDNVFVRYDTLCGNTHPTTTTTTKPSGIPGVMVTGSCGSPNNFMDITNNRTTSITITVGGIDTDTGTVNFIDSRTYAPGQHATINIAKKYDNATAQDDSNPNDNAFIDYAKLCGNTHPTTTTTTAGPPDNLHSATYGTAEAEQPVCNSDGTWSLTFALSIHWRAAGVPDSQIKPREVAITHWESSGVGSGDHPELWHPNPMPEQRDQFSSATATVSGQGGQLNTTVRFQPVGQPEESLTDSVPLDRCNPTSTTTTLPASTTTTTSSQAIVHVTPKTVAAGGSVTVSGGGFAANQQLQINFFSTPVSLGPTTSDGSGNFSAAVTIPSATSLGKHDIGVSGQGPGGILLQGVDNLTVVSAVTPAAATPATAVSASPNFTG